MIEKAKLTDLSEIVAVIESARAFLKAQEIDQWQKSAYPAAADVRSDIENNVAYVLKVDGKVAAYAAVMTGFDPAYDLIHGAWRNDSHDYVTVHQSRLCDRSSHGGINGISRAGSGTRVFNLSF